MRRLPEDQRLAHKFLIGCTQTQHDTVMAEAEARGMAPTIIARECFRRGLELLQHGGVEAVPAVRPTDRPPRPRTGQAGTGKTAAALIQQRQAKHDALCLPHLRVASGPADAIERLEAAGIPSPSSKTPWGKVAVWRICKRHGISYVLGEGTEA